MASTEQTAARVFRLGASLSARAFFKAAGQVNASFDYTESSAIASSSWTCDLHFARELGTEVLVNPSAGNLTPEASLLRFQPSAWKARYGTEVVTRRSRGIGIILRVVCSTQSESRATSYEASIRGSGSYGVVQANIASDFKSTIQTALSQGHASIEAYAWGGDLNFQIPSNPLNFDAWINEAHAYMSRGTEQNAAIRKYGTVNWAAFVPAATTPFEPDLSDPYFRYMGLLGKIDAVEQYLESAPTSRSWVPEPELKRLAKLLPLLKSRAEEVKAAGRLSANPLIKNPPAVVIPPDIPAPLPKYNLTFLPYIPTGWSRLLQVRVTGIRSGCYGSWRPVAEAYPGQFGGPFPHASTKLAVISQTGNETTFQMGHFPNEWNGGRVEFEIRGPANDTLLRETVLLNF